MADKKMQAQLVYQTICAALDNRNWKYNKNPEKLMVSFGVKGEDLPLEFVILADEDRQLIRVLSPLPFKMSEDKRIEGAVAACAATFGMADGGFDYDVQTGGIVFRMTACYRESLIGENLIQYLISCACTMVDKYNDKFLALSKGFMSLEDFLQEKQ